MSNGDHQWGNVNRGRGNTPSFADNKSPNYSPSASYNYAGQVNYQSQQQNVQSQNPHQQQHPRRRTDRYKRESLAMSDRLVKQNETIIRLLKEIRDRLPHNGQGSTDRPHKRRHSRDGHGRKGEGRAHEELLGDVADELQPYGADEFDGADDDDDTDDTEMN